MSDSNNSFFDNVSTKITASATDQKEKISNSVTKAENISNNNNLSTSTKVVASAFAAKEVYDSITKAIPNLIDATIEAPILGIIESLGLKGMACLPIAKQLDPVLGIDIHMVTIPPSPAPVPMPHPFIGILLNPRDFISIAAAVLVAEFKDPIVPVDSENLTEKEQQDMNIEAIKDITYSIIKSKYGLNATVLIDGRFPRAVAGTPTKNIPHFPMGTGFHPGYSRMVKKDNGHSLLGSLVALADGAPISGGQAHLFNCCWDIGIFSPHSKSKRRKIGVELYLPTGIIIPFPMSKTILTNPIPAPFNPITKLQNFVKSSFGRFFKKKVTSKGKKKENNPNETLPPGTRRNAAGRLIDSKTGKFVKDPNKKRNTKNQTKPKPPFKRNPKHNKAEYNKQLKQQQDAINKMKTKEWLKNREDFKNRNKKEYNKKAKEARDKYRKTIRNDKYNEYRKQGFNKNEASKKADEFMKGKAALHNPDGVAGGNINQVTGMGDTGVNSSLGSQWNNGRALSIENQIKASYGIPPNTIDSIPDSAIMNVNLF